MTKLTGKEFTKLCDKTKLSKEDIYDYLDICRTTFYLYRKKGPPKWAVTLILLKLKMIEKTTKALQDRDK